MLTIGRSNVALYFAMLVALFVSSTTYADDSGCSAIQYRSMKPPRYPAEAVISHIEGTVKLLATVGLDGVPTDITVNSSSGNVYLDNAAIEAVKVWRFEPKRCAGKAIISQVALPVKFSLADLDADPSSFSAPKWDVAPDDEPMGFSEVKDALPFLKKHPNVQEMPAKNPWHLAFDERGGTGTKVWFVDTDRVTGWTTIMRWRQVKRSDTRMGLYAYLCNGAVSYCADMRREMIEYMKDHPLPPPPPLQQ